MRVHVYVSVCGDWVRVERDGEGRGRRERAGKEKKKKRNQALSQSRAVCD